MGLDDNDLRALETRISDQPAVGPVMRGTGGLRKMRFAPPSHHTGKSGSMRVGYVVFEELGTIYLLVIFPENEKASLSPAECKYFRKVIEALKQYTEDLRGDP